MFDKEYFDDIDDQFESDNPINFDNENETIELLRIDHSKENVTLNVHQDDIDILTNSIVPQTDDPRIPQFTFRVFFLGTFWCVLFAFANTVLSFRTNSFDISVTVCILLTYPMGSFMARVLPKGYLNPGPFNVKEHVLISIIASAGGQGAYGLDNVIVQKYKAFFGNDDITLTESMLWVFATQFVGFGIAGLTRRFLIKPKAMLFPGVLSQIALYTTLHKPDLPSGRWKLSRQKFFWCCFVAVAIYTWLPNFFMSSLSAVSILCLVGNLQSIHDTSIGKLMRGLGNSAANYGVGLFTLTVPFINLV